MKPLVVIGAGDMATNVVDQFNLEEKVIQFFDDPTEAGEMRLGIPVSLDAPKNAEYISVVGDTRIKRALINRLLEKHPHAKFTNLVGHRLCFIVKTVRYDVGNVIQPMTNLYARVKIGNHNLLCGGSRVGHDTVLGSYITLAPEVAIAGGCMIGDGAFLGLNCSVQPNIKVGKGAIVGAGAVVTKDVPPNHVVVGNPARDFRTEEKWW